MSQALGDKKFDEINPSSLNEMPAPLGLEAFDVPFVFELREGLVVTSVLVG